MKKEINNRILGLDKPLLSNEQVHKLLDDDKDISSMPDLLTRYIIGIDSYETNSKGSNQSSN